MYCKYKVFTILVTGWFFTCMVTRPWQNSHTGRLMTLGKMIYDWGKNRYVYCLANPFNASHC